MSRYSVRNNLQRKFPLRVLSEEAPLRLRLELRDLMIEQFGAVEAHKRLCQFLHISDEDVFSDSWARPRIEENIANLEWFEVFDCLEEVIDEADRWDQESLEEKINIAFAQSGLVYEMRDRAIERLDKLGHELQVHGQEELVVGALSGVFSPVKEQYEKALTALHGRPTDLKLVIANSLNALEAVTRIITNKETSQLGECLKTIYGSGAEDHHKALANMLKNLYGYASTVPGARHAQHKDAEVSFDEALLCVRISGTAMAYLIAEYQQKMD